MARPEDFRVGRGENEMTNLMPGVVYRFTLADLKWRKIDFGNFPDKLSILSDRAVDFGFTEDGVAGADAPNADKTIENERVDIDVTTPVIYVANRSGTTATVYVRARLSQIPVPSDFGEFTAVNGFDGGDASDAVSAEGDVT